MRTLDEEILYLKEVANRNREQWKNCPADRRDIKHQTCEECAEEFEQLVKWLEQLKEYMINEFQCHLAQQEGITIGYEKAINDLIKKCDRAKFTESDEIVLSDIHQGTNSGLSMAIHYAEELLKNRYESNEECETCCPNESSLQDDE